jgi:PDF receptor
LGACSCWFGYSFTATYWVLEGPRLAIIIVNLLLLLNIIRVLVTKLRDSLCSEAEQLR